MKDFRRRVDIARASLFCFTAALLVFCCAVHCDTSTVTTQPLVLSAQMKDGRLIYRLDGKRVEDSVQNSLLTNLGRVVRARGTDFPVWIIIDVHAPFSEVGKLETALDMSDLTNRRVFVTDFADRIMNEIHWDERPIPMPKVY